MAESKPSPQGAQQLKKEPPTVMIGCAIRDNGTFVYHDSIMRCLATPMNVARICHKPVRRIASISKARNRIAAFFLNPPAGTPKQEWLMMVDDDMQFTSQDILRLISRGKKLIGGLYAHRNDLLHPETGEPICDEKGERLVLYVLNTLDEKPFHPKSAEVQEVRYVGTGFMLIHRTVIEEMVGKHPELEYVTDPNEGKKPEWGLFDEYILNRRRLSCDWAFCQRYLDLGGKVFVDCGRKIGHLGEKIY